ncbi:hypothetical protein BHE74_00018103, partial [Ensete ventricosum]
VFLAFEHIEQDEELTYELDYYVFKWKNSLVDKKSASCVRASLQCDMHPAVASAEKLVPHLQVICCAIVKISGEDLTCLCPL